MSENEKIQDSPVATSVFGATGAPLRAVFWHEEAALRLFDPAQPEKWFAPEEIVALSVLGNANAKRRREWLCARIALKSLLVSDRVVQSAPEAVVRKDERGCPRVSVWREDKGRREDIPCSLSHSFPFVLCAYALPGTVALGVDIEPRTWRLGYMHRKFIAPGDKMLPKDDSAGDDTLLWSFKESLSKALGTGWSCGFCGIECRETAPGECILTDAAGEKRPGRYVWFGKWALTATWQVDSPHTDLTASREEPAATRQRRFFSRLFPAIDRTKTKNAASGDAK